MYSNHIRQYVFFAGSLLVAFVCLFLLIGPALTQAQGGIAFLERYIALCREHGIPPPLVDSRDGDKELVFFPGPYMRTEYKQKEDGNGYTVELHINNSVQKSPAPYIQATLHAVLPGASTNEIQDIMRQMELTSKRDLEKRTPRKMVKNMVTLKYQYEPDFSWYVLTADIPSF